jgi:PAS domain-containing protein
MKDEPMTQEQIIAELTVARRRIAELEKSEIEYRQMEKKTSDIDTQTKIIIEKNVDGIIVVNKKGLARFVNPAAQLLLGRKAEEMIGALFGYPLVAGEATEVDIFIGKDAIVVAEMRSVEILWEGEDAYLISLRDVTERKKAEQAIAEANEERVKQMELELSSLIELSQASQTGVTAGEVVTLIESFPDTFRNLVAGYGELMDLALEQQAYKVEHDISGRLGAMAEKLGFYKAGPRDVIDIHTTALKEKTRKIAGAEKKKAYSGEGWIMVIELMGHLVSFYRNLTQGTSTHTDPKT